MLVFKMDSKRKVRFTILEKIQGFLIRPDHKLTIPLCPKHHRFGKVSVHLGKKAFVERYGTEQEILEKVNREIERCQENQDIF